MRGKIGVVIAVVAVLLVGLLLFLKKGKAAPSRQPVAVAKEVVAAAPSNQAAAVQAPSTTNAVSKLPKKKSLPKSLTGSELVTKTLDGYLDDDDYDKVVAEAKRLKKNEDSEVRSRVAFALHWAGLKGLAELTSMLNDPDPGVAREVLDYWKMSLNEIENSSDKAALLASAVAAYGDGIDKESLGSILSEFSMVDEADALPQLASILKLSNNSENTRIIIETIKEISQDDQKAENKDDAFKIIGKRQQEGFSNPGRK